jgi:glycosyltransferase involved in cell wall biosynthesis
MRILFPVNHPFFLERGPDVRLVKTARALAELGHRVTLMIGRTAPRAEVLAYYGVSDHPGLEMVQLPVLRRRRWPRLSWHGVFHLGCLFALMWTRARARVDILHLSDMKLARFLLPYLDGGKARWIYEAHGLHCFGEPGRGFDLDPIEGAVFARMDHLVATTRTLADILQHKCGLTRPVSVVPLATDIPDGGRTARPRRPGAPRIFYVGQLYPLQGVDCFVEALAELPGVEGHIVGGQPGQIASLRRVAQECGVASRVTFYGFVRPADLSRLLVDADLFVLPARAQGKMPYVGHVKLYEYMAWGRPIVASDLPSVREDLRDGENGLLIPPEDPRALAAAIRRAVEDAELAARLGVRAREAAQQYTYLARAARLVEVYQRVLSHRT